MTPKFKAQIVGTRIIVWDIEQGAELYENGFFGKPIGVRKPNIGDEFRDPAELSFFEALYLLEKKKIKIVDEKDNPLSKDQIIKRCNEQYIDFDKKMEVYRYLRDLGYIVRPGLKFGVDFASK